jgi:hypothetical protein
MSTDDQQSESVAHAAIRDLAASLYSDGVEPFEICDALVVTGLNASIRMMGREPAISFLKRVVAALESGTTVERMN